MRRTGNAAEHSRGADGCGLKIMYIRKKDISRRAKDEEEKQIEAAETWGGALRWLDRPILFLPFAPLRLCASFLFSILSGSTFDGNHIIARPHPYAVREELGEYRVSQFDTDTDTD